MCCRPEQSQRHLQEKVREKTSTFFYQNRINSVRLPPSRRFLDKTKNEWENREQFEKVAGKYDMVFMDYSTEDKVRNKGHNCVHCLTSFKHSDLVQEQKGSTEDTQKQPSKLDAKIQMLLELICDLKAMEECVLEMKFDVRKAPLGQRHARRSVLATSG